MTTGPLTGLRVLEMGGIGPGPHAAMILSDWGADVIRIERPTDSPRRLNLVHRGQRIVELDLRQEADRHKAMGLVGRANVLIEGFRPGTMERLGLGPDECLAQNELLVFGRMTGWGQTGPMSNAAGHDINYLSLTGALHTMGPRDTSPSPPLNLVADYGGGSVMLVAAVLAAIHSVRAHGRGQVIDLAMVDGVSVMLQAVWNLRQQGLWNTEREANLLDGGAHFYRTYRCADGADIAVGAIERPFYAELLEGLGLPAELIDKQNDRDEWPAMREQFAELFRTKTRDEWAEVFDGTDACVTPVLTMDEAAHHPQVGRRGAVVEGEHRQVGVAPRFSGAPDLRVKQSPIRSVTVDDVMASWSD